MIKRTIEVSRQATHLSVRHGQLVIQPIGEDKSQARTVPCEDIGVVLISHPAVTYTHRALASLAEAGAAVVVCGDNHLPAGMLLPISTHTQVVSRVQAQINATLPAQKRLWQQLVIAKVTRQADNLPPEHPIARALRELAAEVKSGDSTHIEGQAARLYWSAWLTPSENNVPAIRTVADQTFVPTTFKRDQDGLDPVNAMLNYGYAVLRAALGRAIVSAGLVPALGIQHCHRANAFALADDLIEPFRPLVDARVRELHHQGRGQEGLDQLTKAALLGLLTHPVTFDQTRGPLMVALHRYLASFVDCLGDVRQKLRIPAWPAHTFEALPC